MATLHRTSKATFGTWSVSPVASRGRDAGPNDDRVVRGVARSDAVHERPVHSLGARAGRERGGEERDRREGRDHRGDRAGARTGETRGGSLRPGSLRSKNCILVSGEIECGEIKRRFPGSRIAVIMSCRISRHARFCWLRSVGLRASPAQPFAQSPPAEHARPVEDFTQFLCTTALLPPRRTPPRTVAMAKEKKEKKEKKGEERKEGEEGEEGEAPRRGRRRGRARRQEDQGGANRRLESPSTIGSGRAHPLHRASPATHFFSSAPPPPLLSGFPPPFSPSVPRRAPTPTLTLAKPDPIDSQEEPEVEEANDDDDDDDGVSPTAIPGSAGAPPIRHPSPSRSGPPPGWRGKQRRQPTARRRPPDRIAP